MPSTYWKGIARGYAPSVATSVFTMSSASYGRLAIKAVNFANNSATPVTVSVWVVPSGGTPTDAYVVVPEWVIPAKGGHGGSVKQWTGFEVLENDGDALYVRGIPGNVLAVTVNGGFSK